jgi:hypothetical protein
MNFEKLKESVEQVVEVVEKVPEPFKERAFEMLFEAAINDATHGKHKGPDERGPDGNHGLKHSVVVEDMEGFPPLKPRFQQFMSRTGLTAEELQKVVEFDGDTPHFTRVPHTDKKATAEAEWVLLLALAEGLKNGVMAVKYDDIRAKCESEGVLDSANFAKHLRGGKIKPLLLGYPESAGEAKRLSNHGEDELAKLVKRLAG